MVIDGSNRTVARAIIQTAGKKDLRMVTLNSMQSVTAKQIAAGTTYLSVMRGNLAALKEALD
jgi:zinc transport system substrate-binding protein